MPSVIVRFPDGYKEFRFPDAPLVEGDIIAHNGGHYRVVSITSHDGQSQTVTVELDSDDLGDLLRSERGAITLSPLYFSSGLQRVEIAVLGRGSRRVGRVTGTRGRDLPGADGEVAAFLDPGRQSPAAAAGAGHDTPVPPSPQ